MNILVVEDQETSRYIISSHLRNWGHTVVDFGNGKAALSHFCSNPNSIDMLITDWNMPFMDGVELARNIRKRTKKSGYVYIILLTIKNEMNDLLKGFTEGEVDDYLIKPFSAVQLRLHVQVAARLTQAERSLRKYAGDLEVLVRQQFQDIRGTQEEIISRLFTALESRDQKTAAHVQRIGAMSAHLGRLFGWDDLLLDRLKAAAPLHDIGMICVSDKLLSKLDALTEEDYAQIQEHTRIGARILSGSQNATIQMAERIALSHHERWDGTGYPQGLSGEEIPLEAQLVAIVDVYDSQLAGKAYRKARSDEEALNYIHHQAGRQFSPILVRLFLKNIDEIKSDWWAGLMT